MKYVINIFFGIRTTKELTFEVIHNQEKIEVTIKL